MIQRSPGIAAAASALTAVGVLGISAPAAAGTTFHTTTSVNLRNCSYPTMPQCTVVTVVPGGTPIDVQCWYEGANVNGDNIWYYVEYNGQFGMITGYFIDTGHDPNPNVSRCG